MSRKATHTERAFLVSASTAAILILSSCAALQPGPAYVAADRATFDVIDPVIRALADTDPANDPDLSGVNGRALIQMLDTWNLRIESAEAAEVVVE